MSKSKWWKRIKMKEAGYHAERLPAKESRLSPETVKDINRRIQEAWDKCEGKDGSDKAESS